MEGGATVCPQRKPSLDASFHSPHFHDHWYALRACRNTWWLTGGAPYGGVEGVGVGGVRLPFFSTLLFSLPLQVCISSDGSLDRAGIVHRQT